VSLLVLPLVFFFYILSLLGLYHPRSYGSSDLCKRSRVELTTSHTCEHLLVAVKIPPTHPSEAPIPWDTHPTLKSLRKGIDTDVVVAEVRETSRKPDEVYGVIERYVSLYFLPSSFFRSRFLCTPQLAWPHLSLVHCEKELMIDSHPMVGN
jgi:hypothetical protein